MEKDFDMVCRGCGVLPDNFLCHLHSDRQPWFCNHNARRLCLDKDLLLPKWRSRTGRRVFWKNLISHTDRGQRHHQPFRRPWRERKSGRIHLCPHRRRTCDLLQQRWRVSRLSRSLSRGLQSVGYNKRSVAIYLRFRGGLIWKYLGWKSFQWLTIPVICVAQSSPAAAILDALFVKIPI